MEHWLIPCSPDIYDAESAFQEYGHVVWHQQCNMKPGDVAFIYVTSPIKEIRCKCLITETDIPFDIGDDEGYVLDESFCARSYRRYMDLQLMEVYYYFPLNYHFLLMNGLSGPIRSQRKASVELVKYIEEVAQSQRDSVKEG